MAQPYITFPLQKRDSFISVRVYQSEILCIIHEADPYTLICLYSHFHRCAGMRFFISLTVCDSVIYTKLTNPKATKKSLENLLLMTCWCCHLNSANLAHDYIRFRYDKINKIQIFHKYRRKHFYHCYLRLRCSWNLQ
jgi:hypothetical protein